VACGCDVAETPGLQEYTKDALRSGLLRYSSGKGWEPGPIQQD